MPDGAVIILCSVITQIIVSIGIGIGNHSKKKYIKEQISCKKREIGDTQKQVTSIVASGDTTLINGPYVKGLITRLKQLKKEVADLNAQLKPKDRDTTKLNITETITMGTDKIQNGGK